MRKLFDLEFLGIRAVTVTAELLEDEAPITAENLWEAMAEPLRARLHHGRHCAAELWCYLPEPKEQIPYENSTVFPDAGDVLYYHFIQPPTRQGRWVFDLGIFYSSGQSRIPPGWLPGNLVARLFSGEETIRQLELIASDLLRGQPIEVVLRQRSDTLAETTAFDQANALQSWLVRLDNSPNDATEADVTRLVAGAEQFAQDLIKWLSQSGSRLPPDERQALRASADRLSELAARWRFATDERVPSDWSGSAADYWRAVIRGEVGGESRSQNRE
jgi:hypothetical protein